MAPARDRRSPPVDPGSGAHFVTLVAAQRCPWFESPAWRQAVECELSSLPERFPGLTLDTVVIMPNHLHLILCLAPQRARARRTARAPAAGTPGRTATSTEETIRRRIRAGQERSVLGQVLQRFKTAVLRRIRRAGGRDFLWEEGYRDLEIWGEQELQAIRRHIQGNPARWAEDVENPGRVTAA